MNGNRENRSVYAGRIISLALEPHALPDGGIGEFEIVRHPGGAAVLPLLADGRVLLIRQFRPAFADFIWEIPGGRLEAGESPERCADRELAEEIGYRAGRLEKLGQMLSTPGFCDEVVHLFLARELQPVPRSPEADEFIESVPLPLPAAFAMLQRGEIGDGKTQLALLLLQALLPPSAP